MAVYDLASDKLSLVNLFGKDQIGRIEVKWEDTWDENYEEWVETRIDRKIYFVKDHLGSIRQSIDVNGSLVSANDYYAFGQTKSYTVAGTTTDKYRYTGKERDQETGLDYFGARYYDSKIGRWLSVDPLSDKFPGWNPYNYTFCNPLRYFDPNGRAPGDFGFLTQTFNNLKVKATNFVEKVGSQVNKVLDNYDVLATDVKKIMNEEVHPAAVKTNSFLNKASVPVGYIGAGITFAGIAYPPLIPIGIGISTSATFTSTLTGVAEGIHTGNNTKIKTSLAGGLIGVASSAAGNAAGTLATDQVGGRVLEAITDIGGTAVGIATEQTIEHYSSSSDQSNIYKGPIRPAEDKNKDQ